MTEAPENHLPGVWPKAQDAYQVSGVHDLMPRVSKIRQRFNGDRLDDIEAALLHELQRVKSAIPSSGTIAIAVGSRGIADIAQIVKITAEFVKAQGASPFIIPAMGSHGGANAAGQTQVLADYGITEAYVGAPVKSSMETVSLPQGNSVVDVFMDRHAWESDGVILVNRIKPHTDYHGQYESGLAKMVVIGLGKHKQALVVHRYGVYGLKELVPLAAKQILATGKILAGVGIVENAYDDIMALRVLRPDEIMAVEPELLEMARANMPKLPVDKIDVLIVDRIGKDISGIGLDPDIIGRLRIPGQPEPTSPDIKAIVVCDLTDASHGNALGMGLADVTTKKLYDKIDFAAMNENVYTSGFLERAKVPIVAHTSEKALSFALRSCGPIPQEELRIMRIRDTLHLGELYASGVILDELRRRDDIEVVGQAVDLFDSKGELAAF